jgi:hypothetical protein
MEPRRKPFDDDYSWYKQPRYTGKRRAGFTTNKRQLLKQVRR